MLKKLSRRRIWISMIMTKYLLLCARIHQKGGNGAAVLETEQEDSDPQSSDENEKMDTRARRSKRQIKPTYKLRPDEIYDHPLLKKDLKKKRKRNRKGLTTKNWPIQGYKFGGHRSKCFTKALL